MKMNNFQIRKHLAMKLEKFAAQYANLFIDNKFSGHTSLLEDDGSRLNSNGLDYLKEEIVTSVEFYT